MLVRRQSPGLVVWYESPLLAAAGIPHAFSTRLGGVSPPPFDSLNLGNPMGASVQDSQQRIERNYGLLQEAIGAAGRKVLKVHQVHGGQVISATGADGCDLQTKADAIVCTDPGHLASVRVADCVPVLLAQEDGAAVAAVHAGWRGVIARIVPAAVERIRKLNGSMKVVAAIGPCIGMDAFEVGPEVLSEFEGSFDDRAPIRRRGDGKGHVDLRRAIAIQLESCGVPPEQIDSTDRCTVRDGGEFFSHRRDNGITGRMAALIGPVR